MVLFVEIYGIWFEDGVIEVDVSYFDGEDVLVVELFVIDFVGNIEFYVIELDGVKNFFIVGEDVFVEFVDYDFECGEVFVLVKY